MQDTKPNLTQAQALIEAQAIFPGEFVTVSRERFLGHTSRNGYLVWRKEDADEIGCGDIVGSSDESWESALIVARGVAEHPEGRDVPFEDEALALAGESEKESEDAG